MNHLLHPDYFSGIPFSGDYLAQALNSQASEVALLPDSTTAATIAIRALNEAKPLERLMEDIQRQRFNGELEIVVVDNESSDQTAGVARSFGAQVVTLPRQDFTYARSMNLAMQAASHENVFLTVGHAALSNDQLLKGGVTYFEDTANQIAGVFAHALPDNRASRTEKFLAIGNRQLMRKMEVHKGGLGVMAATGALLRKTVWLELGKFDEHFETGGEDGAMANAMLRAGYRIFDDPILSVHHTHGLGPIDTVKQWRHWFKTATPQKLELQKLASRRPDIDLS